MRKTFLLLLLAVAGCVGAPEGVEVVDDFELDRYLGTWYEIARLDHRFERGLSGVTATYSMRDDGGVRVLNRGYNKEEEVWEEAEGKAYFVGEPTVGQLKVSFFGPFYGGYNIMALDRDRYQYALVAGPNRNYLWLLSRTPEMSPDQVERLVEIADANRFPIDELIYVNHDEYRE